MHYIHRYESPLGGILLACDDTGLTGLWFDGAKHFAEGLDPLREERNHPFFDAAIHWMDRYFSGEKPEAVPPLHLVGSPFRVEVWNLLREIPYGETTTYGAIAGRIAARRKVPFVSARAVGGAIGHNRISLILPCHRVLGKDGNLTGYAGGIDKKKELLALERAGIA